MAQSILIDLDDPRTAAIADMMTNPSARKILSLLAEKELSKSEIALQLKIPLPTVDYTIKRLMQAGIVERARQFFWSTRGKKVVLFRVSQKRIVISPKKIARGIVPALIGTVAAATFIRFFEFGKNGASIQDAAIPASESVRSFATEGGNAAISEGARIGYDETVSSGVILQKAMICASSSAEWFLLGAFCALLIVLIWNWRKIS